MGEDEIGRLMEGMPTSDGENHSIRVHSADSANQKLVETWLHKKHGTTEASEEIAEAFI